MAIRKKPHAEITIQDVVEDFVRHVRRTTKGLFGGNVERQLAFEMDIIMEWMKCVIVESRPLELQPETRKAIDQLEKRIRRRQK